MLRKGSGVNFASAASALLGTAKALDQGGHERAEGKLTRIQLSNQRIEHHDHSIMTMIFWSLAHENEDDGGGEVQDSLLVGDG